MASQPPSCSVAASHLSRAPFIFVLIADPLPRKMKEREIEIDD